MDFDALGRLRRDLEASRCGSGADERGVHERNSGVAQPQYVPVPGFPLGSAPNRPADKGSWLQAALKPPGALASAYTAKSPPTADDSKARPLKAGVQIAPDGGPGYGTLGFFLHLGSSPDRVFAVTNWHVVAASRITLDVIGQRMVSQPDTSCLGCTTNYIGKVAAGSRNENVDFALIELKSGMKYTADIRGLNGKDGSGNDIDAPVRGIHVLTHQEITSQTVQVKKRGFVTGLTGGKIVPDPDSADGTVMSEVEVMMMNQLNGLYQVSANPGANPADLTIFSTHGDSGSAVILDTDPSDPNYNRIVGLHVAGNPAPPAGADIDTPRAPYSVFIPIKAILDFVHTDSGVAGNLGLTAAQQQALTVLTANGAEPGPCGSVDPSLDGRGGNGCRGGRSIARERASAQRAARATISRTIRPPSGRTGPSHTRPPQGCDRLATDGPGRTGAEPAAGGSEAGYAIA
jgi:hypothetical protein